MPDDLALLTRATPLEDWADRVDLYPPQRPVGRDVGQGVPPGPQRLPSRLVRRLIAQQSLAPPYTRVREVERYPDVIVLPFSIGTAGIAGAQQVLNVDAKERIFLAIRNSTGSGGTLFIGFGLAADDSTASFALAAGQQVMFDNTVPQTALYLSTNTATTTGVVTYGLAEF